MAYTPTVWNNDAAPPISAANLNKIEQGIDEAHDALVPTGGTTDQVLAKSSATDYALKWATPAAGGGASSDEIVISATEPTDPEVTLWINPSGTGGSGGAGGGGLSDPTDASAVIAARMFG